MKVEILTDQALVIILDWPERCKKKEHGSFQLKQMVKSEEQLVIFHVKNDTIWFMFRLKK